MATKAVNEGFLVTLNALDKTENTTIDLSTSVSSIYVQENYMNHAFPLFIFNFQVTEEEREILALHNVELSLKVEIFDATVNNGSETETIDVYPSDVLLETIIRIYDRPVIQSKTKSDEDAEETESVGRDESLPLLYYQVSGIPKDLIKTNRSVINRIYQNASLNEILVNILSEISSKSVYIENAHNQERPKSLLIPPLSPVPAVHFLQNSYGIYHSPLTLFFGNEKTYCCPLNSERSEYDRNFSYIIKTSNSTGDQSIYSNPVIEENDESITVYAPGLSGFSNSTDLLGDELGTTSVFFSYDDNFNTVFSNEQNAAENSEKVRYFWNENSDNLFVEEFKKTIKTRKSLEIHVSNIRPSYFTPQTKFVVSGEEEVANGEYFLLEKNYGLTSSDNKHFQMATVLKLVKK